MSKICNDKGGFDKVKHVAAEFVIAIVTGIVLSSFTSLSAWAVALIAFAVATVFGVGREVKGAMQKGNHFCVWDLAWGTVGAVAGSLFSALIQYATSHDISGNLIQ